MGVGMRSSGHASLPLHRPYAAALALGLLALIGCYEALQGGSRPAMPGDYIEERLAPDRWSVRGSARTPERARDLAFHRGAVLVKAGGYSHVRVVSYRLAGFDYSNAPIVNQVRRNPAPRRAARADRVSLQVAGTNDPAAPLACDASVTAETMCRNMSVDEALAAFGDRLGLTPDQSAAEVDAARRALAARSGGG